jgi:hypothetical protein
MLGRRRLLKGLGLAMVGAAFRPVLVARPAAAASKSVAAGGRLYRVEGTRVLVSADSGATWQVHTDFTSVYSLKGLSTNRSGGLQATLGYEGRSFGLALAPDQRAWLTV